jgi:putative hydrolase of the HAD superfamily
LAVEIEPLLRAFRRHRPQVLHCYDGVYDALRRLRANVRLAVVTDGDVAIQSAKLAALELNDLFDVAVLSDDIGREFRKPHPVPFRRALRLLGTEPEDAVFVGDRPDKDIVGALGVGLRAVRVRTGEYRAQPDVIGTLGSFDDATDAIAFLESDLPVAVS